MSKHAPRGRIKARPEDANPLEARDPLEGICTATSKRSGLRCKRHAILGGTVCPMHGGSAPQVKLKALTRLAAYQDRAIDRLFQLAEQTAYPSTSLSAVRDVLDRTLGKPIESVAVDHSGGLTIRHELPE